MKLPFKSLLVVSILGLTAIEGAYAHRVNIFAYTEGDTVKTESSFSGGSLVRQGTVTIEDPSTHTILGEGKTDEKGLYDFSLKSLKYIPKDGLLIQINAGEGHQNSWTLDPSELGTVTPSSSPEAALTSPPEPIEPLQPNATMSLSAQELEAILDRKLAPIKRDLAAATDKEPTMRDMVGGIGWLFGLFGVWALTRRSYKTKG